MENIQENIQENMDEDLMLAQHVEIWEALPRWQISRSAREGTKQSVCESLKIGFLTSKKHRSVKHQWSKDWVQKQLKSHLPCVLYPGVWKDPCNTPQP